MSCISSSVSDLSTQECCAHLAQVLPQRGWMMVSAESCTGGLIAAACTDLAGSSVWFERGFVTYSNAAKCELLGVDVQSIEQHGAVSEAVARAMALGAIRHSRAQVALAVTGIAGPSGGAIDKPVGTVWFSWAVQGAVHTQLQRFDGDRAAVRAAAVQHGLAELVRLVTAAT